MTQETFDALNAESDWLLGLVHRTLCQAHLCDAIRERATERIAAFGAEKAKPDPLFNQRADFPPDDDPDDTPIHAGPDVSELEQDPS